MRILALLLSQVVLLAFLKQTVEGTLAQAKSSNNHEEFPSLNNIAKHGKEKMEDDEAITVSPISSPSTPAYDRNHGVGVSVGGSGGGVGANVNIKGKLFKGDKTDKNPNQNHGAAGAIPPTAVPKMLESGPGQIDEHSAKTHKIIEMTALVCGITVAVMVFILSARLCYLLYRKCGKALPPRASEAAVRYQTNSVPTSVTSTPSASIYTVMPGHFVIQPCYTNATTTISPNNGCPVPTTTNTALPGESLQVVTCYRSEPSTSGSGNTGRPETPPPPYPGPLKGAEEK